MRKFNSFIISAGLVIIASIGMTACSKKTETTSDGIEYTYIKEGKVETKNGEFVVYHFVAKTGNDSVFMSSYDQPTPPYLVYNDSTEKINGMDEIFLGLKRGDSIVINSTADKIFMGGTPPFLEVDEQIQISIGVVDVLAEEVFQDYYNDLGEAYQKRQEEHAKVQLQEDIKVLEDYIAENNLSASRTESGLFYVIEEEGNGAEVEQGSTVSVNYTGYVLDGSIFDTSIENVARESNTFMEGRNYEPIEFQVGMQQVIEGWDEGLQYLRKGSKAKLLIPSTMAYGDRQVSEVIKANSVLVFDIEVTDVK